MRHSADEEGIKKLLIECLEMHYGNLEKAIIQQDEALNALKSIQHLTDKVLNKPGEFKIIGKTY